MGRTGGKRPPKHDDVLGLARLRLAEERYRDTRHAAERKEERDIQVTEIWQVIESGFHEERKDQFNEGWRAWNYALRGKTDVGRSLRIAVSFDPEDDCLLIITAIDLNA